MKLHGLVLLVALCGFGGNAQITFYATNLPGQVGQYYRAYFGTNYANPAALSGQTNGPQLWDFSQPPQANETPHRFDVVSTNDNNVYPAADFPEAVYAERETYEDSGNQTWSYYRLDSTSGRLYYGFIVPFLAGVSAEVVFSNRTFDVPASVQLGQTWSRVVDLNYTLLRTTYKTVHFVDQSQVDAYGTIKLPQLGTFPALRVREVHTLEESDYDLFLGWVYAGTQTNIHYLWLAQGLGVAADFTLFGPKPDSTPPIFTNALYRTFESSLQPLLAPVTGLTVHRVGAQVWLNWNPQTNGSGYQINSLGKLAGANWTTLSSPITNSYTEPITTTQRFYQVFSKP